MSNERKPVEAKLDEITNAANNGAGTVYMTAELGRTIVAEIRQLRATGDKQAEQLEAADRLRDASAAYLNIPGTGLSIRLRTNIKAYDRVRSELSDDKIKKRMDHFEEVAQTAVYKLNEYAAEHVPLTDEEIAGFLFELGDAPLVNNGTLIRRALIGLQDERAQAILQVARNRRAGRENHALNNENGKLKAENERLLKALKAWHDAAGVEECNYENCAEPPSCCLTHQMELEIYSVRLRETLGKIIKLSRDAGAANIAENAFKSLESVRCDDAQMWNDRVIQLTNELVKERARKEFLQQRGAEIQAVRGYGYYSDKDIDIAIEKEKQ